MDEKTVEDVSTRNDSETRRADTGNRRGIGSRPVRYQLIDKDGNHCAFFSRAEDAGHWAKRIWPDQEQDEDRTGKGWDVQVVGAE